MNYQDFSLTNEQIEHIKRKNAEIAIRKYIKKNGQEPSDISSFFTISDKDIELYKRIFYSIESIYNKNNDNIFINSLIILSNINEDKFIDDFKYSYWRIFIYKGSLENYRLSGTAYKVGNFSDLEKANITLPLNEQFSFIIYLIKSNNLHNKLGNETIDNNFHNPVYHNLYDYNNDGFFEDDKEFFGIIDSFQIKENQPITGTVYTFNPKLSCIFENYDKEKGIIYSNKLNKNKEIIKFWYSDDNFIKTNGDGIINIISNTSFSYTFSKKELVNRINVSSEIVRNNQTCFSSQSNPEAIIGMFNLDGSRNGINFSINKENYISSNLNPIYSLKRNSLSTITLNVPNLNSETDVNFNINIKND